MSKTTNKFAPEVRERAVRMVFDHERDHPSRWAAVVSVAEKIGCAPQTLHESVKKTEVNSGKRAGVPTEVADKVRRSNVRSVTYGRPTRFCVRRPHILRRWSSTARSGDDRVHRRSPRCLWGRADLPCPADHPIYLPRARRAVTGSDTPIGAGDTMLLSSLRSRACSPRISRSTVCARSGGG